MNGNDGFSTLPNGKVIRIYAPAAFNPGTQQGKYKKGLQRSTYIG